MSEAAVCGQLEVLVAQRPRDALLVAAVAMHQLLVAVAPLVGDAFDEEHDEDIVLVLGGVNSAAKSVACSPEDVVDFVLVDWVHSVFLVTVYCPI